MSSDNQFYHGRITRRVDFAPDLWSIRVNPGGKFKFRPGQYATLGVQSGNKRSERAYSIVSSPHENEVEFFIELVPGGELTSQLYNLRSDNEILMRKVPKGRFLLQTNEPYKNHLLVSTVTGVAPYVSYIRSLMNDDREGKFPAGNRLFLLNGASRSWEFGYHQELANIASGAKWLIYVRLMGELLCFLIASIVGSRWLVRTRSQGSRSCETALSSARVPGHEFEETSSRISISSFNTISSAAMSSRL